MKARSNQPATQAAASSNATPTQSYAPSVPITIYRELAAELDATRALLENVHAENQQLQQQNQQLRHEIDRLVQSALNLRSYTESTVPIVSMPASAVSFSGVSAAGTTAPAAEFESVAAQLRSNSVSESASDSAFDSVGSPISEDLIASTQVADLPQSLTSESKPKGLGGLWLTLTVIAIVIGAFGAGFFLVKPLLQNR